jgi:hypothetical protein
MKDAFHPLTTEFQMQTTPWKAYASNLTDAQGAIFQSFLPPAKPSDRKRTVDLRERIHTILYFNRIGR